MRKKRHYHHPPGTAPATLVARGEAPSVVSLIQYDKDSYTEWKSLPSADLFPRLAKDKVNWINIDGLSDLSTLEEVGQHFSLHPLAMEDVLHTPQRPKIEQFKDHFFIVAQFPLWKGNDEVAFEQVSLFLGENYLLTIQERPLHELFEPVRERLRAGRGFSRSRGHDYLAYALLDCVVDHFFPVLEELGESIEALETELLERPSRSSVARLQQLKRTLLQVRRHVWPLRELFTILTREESPLISRETMLFLRDCYDHTIRIMDLIENYRDLTASLMEIYISSIEMRTNEVVRALTVVSTIFIPLTFITGIFGMNFEGGIPGTRSPGAFWACVSSMIALAAFLLAFFRSKRWI